MFSGDIKRSFLFIDIVVSRYSEKELKTTNQNQLHPPFT